MGFIMCSLGLICDKTGIHTTCGNTSISQLSTSSLCCSPFLFQLVESNDYLPELLVTSKYSYITEVSIMENLSISLAVCAIM